MNALYRDTPELSVLDYDPGGFQWIDCKDVDHSVFIIMRRGQADADTAAALFELDRVPAPDRERRSTTGGASGHAARDLQAGPERAEQRARLLQAMDATRPFIISACNFTPVVLHGYAVGMPRHGRYREI